MAGPVVSVTRLRLASARHLPRFALHAWRSVRQARAARGFLGLHLLADRRLAFWTATAWADAAALGAFTGSGAHRAAMPLMAAWCDEGAVVRLSAGPEALGDWAGAHACLVADGRPTPVRRPSAAQRARAWPVPRVGPLRRVAFAPGASVAVRPAMGD